MKFPQSAGITPPKLITPANKLYATHTEKTLSVSNQRIAKNTSIMIPLMMMTPFDPSIEVNASKSIGSIAWKFHSAAFILFAALVGIVGRRTGAAVGMRVGVTAPTEPMDKNITIPASKSLAMNFKVKFFVMFITPSV